MPNNKRIRTACMLCLTAVLFLLVQQTTAQTPERASEAQKVTSEILLNNTFQYDGKTVIYFGEVVGDVMERGQMAWISVYDGTYAIGVYVPLEMLEENMISGDYHHKGDMIEVTGMFNRACREHGGDTDIHAKSVRVIALGYVVEHPVSMSKVFFTLLVLVANIPLIIVMRRIKKCHTVKD
ncbi:MAG: DNA-binding protein [Candidatus Altiarchaeales archaeon]|nr:DNA-binding protein [Candidatus Altiarchaeales archaeon]